MIKHWIGVALLGCAFAAQAQTATPAKKELVAKVLELQQPAIETLSRTVVTTTSLLITLVALLVLGPDVIFGFTAAITFGIFVGTYSSIFMSTPILIWLGVTGDSFVPQETRADAQDRKARGGA